MSVISINDKRIIQKETHIAGTCANSWDTNTHTHTKLQTTHLPRLPASVPRLPQTSVGCQLTPEVAVTASANRCPAGHSVRSRSSAAPDSHRCGPSLLTMTHCPAPLLTHS